MFQMLNTLFFLLFLPLYASLKISEFPHTRGLPESLKQAKLLEFSPQNDELKLKGAIMGPAKGDPVLFSHGYYGSAGYWADVGIPVANNGFRVYMPSLRGMGQGVLRSNFSRPRGGYERHFGLDEMIRDHIELIDAIYNKHKKPIIWVGHSLAGVIIRAVSTGPMLEGEKHYFSEELRARLRKQIKLAIIYKSPSPVISNAEILGIEIGLKEKWQLIKGQMIITSILPSIAAIKDNALFRNAEALASYAPMVDLITSLGLRVSDFFLSDVMASRDLQGSRTFESFTTSTAERLEKDIVKDLRRIIREGFRTRRGLDLGSAHLDPSTIDSRFPMLIVSGKKDILGLSRFNQIEADLLKLRHIISGYSHMEGLIGLSAATTAEIILREIDPERDWDLSNTCKLIF